MKVVAIIAAGGKGKRMKNKGGKQFLPLLGKPLLYWTLKKFEEHPLINEICLVISKNSIKNAQQLVRKYALKKVKAIIVGGKERTYSIYNGLKNIDRNTDIVVLHDGARPFISNQIITKSIKSARLNQAVIVAVPLKDTIKQINKLKVINTPKRSNYWSIQTPQVFKYSLIVKAYEKAMKKRIIASDDAAIVESYGKKVHIVMGDYKNIKITTKEDLIMAIAILLSSRKKHK